MIDEIMKRLSELPKVTYLDGQEYIQLYDAMETVKRAVEQEPWIPVSEGLPEERKTVIASTDYGVYPEARFTKEDGWEWAYESGADYWESLEYVQAWMPLPKSYKPQDKEIKESKIRIPYLMHKEMDIPLSECQKAYDVAIDYLRSQGKLRG